MGETRWLPGHRVGIPRQHYKIIVRNEAGELKVLAFLFINGSRHPLPPGTQGVEGRRINAKEADQYLDRHLVSIAFIERLTGLDHFATMPLARKEALTLDVAGGLWSKN